MSDVELVLASELGGRAIVALDTGDDLAEISSVVFDPATHVLVGFSLETRGWFTGEPVGTLPASAVTAIGPDALMVRSADALEHPDDEAPTPTGAGFTVIGVRALTEDGEELGRIDDVVLDVSDELEAVGYEVRDGGAVLYVPITAQLALSEDNVVVPAETRDRIRHDLADFAASIAGSDGDGGSEGERDRPSAEAPAYERWTKENLYERARRLKVEGRSKMTKAELVEALREHR